MTAIKEFICETCSRSFTRCGDLVRHRRTHTGDRPYACTWPGCSRVFAQSSGLTVHMNTHTKAKPHACRKPGCGKVFSDPSSRTRHYKEFHCKGGAYQCPVKDCSSSIKRRSAFAAHLRSRHGIEPSTLNIEALLLENQAAPLRHTRARKSSRTQSMLALPKVSLPPPSDSTVKPAIHDTYFNVASTYPTQFYDGFIAHNTPSTFQYPAAVPPNDFYLAEPYIPPRSMTRSPALTHSSSAASTPSPCRTPEPTEPLLLSSANQPAEPPTFSNFDSMKHDEQLQWLLASLDAAPALFTPTDDVPRQDSYRWGIQTYMDAGIVAA